MFYRLVDREPVACSAEEMAEFSKGDRHVGFEFVETDRMTWAPLGRVGWLVSTVFLGIDHGFSLEGPPVLFETMVFPALDEDRFSPANVYQMRYTTWAQAEEGHRAVVEGVRDVRWVIQMDETFDDEPVLAPVRALMEGRA